MSDAPRRLHAGTILIRLLKSAPSTVVALPALLAVGTEFPFLNVLLFTVLAIGVLVLTTWIGWRHYTYAVTADELVIAQGLVQRSRRSIPLHRVQDVSIEQKPLQRLLGLALVRVETGGGKADEATLDSVTMAEARRLRGALRQVHAVPVADFGQQAAGRPVFAMSLGRVLLYGLFSFSLLWIAAIYGALQWLDNLFHFGLRHLFGLAEREVRGHLTILAALSVLAAALTLGVIAGIVRKVVAEFGFNVSERGGRLHRIRGLLTRSEVVIVKTRIQAALTHRAPLRGRLGWAALELQTLGGSDDASGRQQVAPFARADEIAAVVDAAGLPRFERQALRQVAAGHIVRAIVRHAPPVLIGFGVAGFFLPPLWFGLLLLPMPVGVALLQRRFHRYALRLTSLQVARGILSQREWIVPYASVQSVTLRRSWLQRRLGLATVSVDTAGARGLHRPDIADVALVDAHALVQDLVERSAA